MSSDRAVAEAVQRPVGDDPKLTQIIAAHKSARPKRENFAWWSTHRDLGYVLEVLAETQRPSTAVQAAARANRILQRLGWLLNGEQISLDDFAGDIREYIAETQRSSRSEETK